jgi:hypothetical protein
MGESSRMECWLGSGTAEGEGEGEGAGRCYLPGGPLAVCSTIRLTGDPALCEHSTRSVFTTQSLRCATDGR